MNDLAQTLRHVFGDILELPVLGTAAPDVSQVSAASPAAELAAYAAKIRFCESCSLHIGRSKLVFGRGHWGARIAFVGDVPSDGDDRTGEPFSDEAGELLHKMILAMKIRPEETYLTNVWKCRPPAKAKPENLACEEHLRFQFSKIGAPVIVALGEAAAKTLARSESPLQVLRKQVFEWQGRRVIPTHHPRDLQRDPSLKKEAWEDLQAAMRELQRLT